MKNFIEKVQTNRWLVIVITILAVFSFIFGASKIQFSGDYKVFFDSNNPYLIAFDKHQNTFDKTDNIMVVAQFTEGDIFDSEHLSILEQMTEELWQTPYASRVDSIVNFQRIQAFGDDIIVAPAIKDAATLSSAQINEISEFIYNEPALSNRLISRQGKLSAFYITQNYPPNPTEQRIETLSFAKALKQRYEQEYPGIQIHVSGLTALNGAFVEATLSDLATLTPMMILAILVIIGLVLRSPIGAISSFVLVIFSAFSALGVGGWLGIPLAPPSLASLNIILILTIAAVVHVLTNFYQIYNEGTDKLVAMQESLALNAKPVLLTSVTTAIGFLSLNFSEAPPYRHLGNIVTIGIVISCALIFTLLPAFMSFIKSKRTVKHAYLNAFMENLARFVIKRRNTLMLSMLLLAGFFAYYSPQNEVSDSYSKYFDHSIPFRNANDAIAEYLPALYSIEFELKARGENGITEPEYLRNVERFAHWLSQQEYVANVLAFSDTMKRINKSMNGDNESYYSIPQNKELASQYLLMYELSLPFGLDLNSQISGNRSSTRLVGSLYNIPTKETLKLEVAANNWIRANLPEYMWTNATSPSIMFSHIAMQNIEAGIKGGIYALLLISVVIMFLLRSVKLGLASIVPNIVPIIVAFGVWALYKGQVGLSLSLVVGITLGILVDDTVHFLSKYQYAKDSLKMAAQDAIVYTFKKVGSAIFITSIALMVGFSIIANSTFAQNSDMATFIVITVFSAMVYDLLLLPTLLLLIEGKKKSSPESISMPVKSAPDLV